MIVEETRTLELWLGELCEEDCALVVITSIVLLDS